MNVTDRIEWQDLGTIPYRNALVLQDDLREKRIRGVIGDRLLLLEHPAVFTVGRRECQEDFLSAPLVISQDGIDIVKTNRGGRVTYHGPGQLVVYFICNLKSLGMGVRDFVRTIEDICLNTLAFFFIKAHRDDTHPGIWIGGNKIAAIGLNVSQGVTEHGLALNIDCDLKPYRHIVACGIKGRSVTSMAMESKRAPLMHEVKEGIVEQTARHLSRCAVEINNP